MRKYPSVNLLLRLHHLDIGQGLVNRVTVMMDERSWLASCWADRILTGHLTSHIMAHIVKAVYCSPSQVVNTWTQCPPVGGER